MSSGHDMTLTIHVAAWFGPFAWGIVAGFALGAVVAAVFVLSRFTPRNGMF